MFPATRCQGARLHRWIAQPSPLHQSQGHQASGDGTSDEGAWLGMARHGYAWLGMGRVAEIRYPNIPISQYP